MKRFLLFVFSLPTLLFGGCFSIGADALYWRPTYPSVNYASDLEGDISIADAVKPDNDWGYRVCVGYGFCSSMFVYGDYFHFEQTNSDSISNTGNVFPYFVHLANPATAYDFASADIRSRYDAGNALFGYQLNCGSCYEIAALLGAHIFRISERENYVFLGTGGGAPDGEAVQRSRLSGAGPELGLDFVLRPFSCCCLDKFGVHAKVLSAPLITRYELSFLSTLPSTVDEGSLTYPRETGTTVLFGFKLEGFYEISCSCLCLRVRGGYELNHYANGRKRLLSATELFGAADLEHSSIGYGGPYIGASLIF